MANYTVQIIQTSSDFCKNLGEFNTKEEALAFVEEFRKTTRYVTVSQLVDACNKAAYKEWDYLHNLEKTDHEKWFEEYMAKDALASVDSSYFEKETMELGIFFEEDGEAEWETIEEYILVPDDLQESKKFYEFLSKYGIEDLSF